MSNKRIRQWMKANNMVEQHDPTIVATLKSDDPNKAHPCFIFRKSGLEKMKKEYGDKLLIIGGNWEV